MSRWKHVREHGTPSRCDAAVVPLTTLLRWHWPPTQRPTQRTNADCIIAIEPLRAPGYASPAANAARHQLAEPLIKAPNRKDSGTDTHSQGNDLELDPNREPEPPTKVIDKPVQRTGKRNVAAEGPAKDAPRPAAAARGGRTDAGT